MSTPHSGQILTTHMQPHKPNMATSPQRRWLKTVQEFSATIPTDIRRVMLISNAKVAFSGYEKDALSKISHETLFLHHNSARNFREFRGYYGADAREALCIQPNHLNSFWGINESGCLSFATADNVNCITLYSLYSPIPDSSIARSSVDNTYNSVIEAPLINILRPAYPRDKFPTCGYITRKLFIELAEIGRIDQVLLCGFSLDKRYLRNHWQGHASSFEKRDLDEGYDNNLYKSIGFIED